jgi:hypothetical protein
LNSQKNLFSLILYNIKYIKTYLKDISDQIILSEHIDFNFNGLFKSDCENVMIAAEIAHGNCVSSCKNPAARTYDAYIRAMWGKGGHILLKRIWKCK